MWPLLEAQLQKLEESWILTPHRKKCEAKVAWAGIGEGKDWVESLGLGVDFFHGTSMDFV